MPACLPCLVHCLSVPCRQFPFGRRTKRARVLPAHTVSQSVGRARDYVYVQNLNTAVDYRLIKTSANDVQLSKDFRILARNTSPSKVVVRKA